jgi:hypothetical protein
MLVRARHPTPLSAPAAPTSKQTVELEDAPLAAEPQPSEPTSSPAPDARSASAAFARSPARASGAHGLAAAESTAAEGALGEAAGGDPAPTAAGSAAPAERKIDLGLDGHFFMRPSAEEPPRPKKSGIQRELDSALAASDVAHGLARGNALLGSLDTAVRDVGPIRGEALFRVTVGPDGSLSDVELLSGQAANWTSALKAFRELAMRKHVRVPAGALGLRVTFAVKAKVQLPSGAEVKGPEVAAPSLAPNGLTLHGTFDVADIGAKPQRLVYAHVVSEEVL